MELPANLDDGELWIPSDIFPTDDALHHNRPTSDVFLEDLSRQLSKINFQSVIPQVFSKFHIFKHFFSILFIHFCEYFFIL